MAAYNESMYHFLKKSSMFGERIHSDSRKAKEIFSQIKLGTNFESVIGQTKSKNFLVECHAFANAIKRWCREYPGLLRDFKGGISFVIAEMQSVDELKVTVNGKHAYIIFNKRQFHYCYTQSRLRGFGRLKISKEHEKLVLKKENRIVQEIAEIISLELHIETFLNFIEMQIKLKKVEYVCNEILLMKDINSPNLVNYMHIICEWWMEVDLTLEKLKAEIITAVNIEKNVSLQLSRLFDEEKVKELREKKIIATKNGLIILSKIALSLIPGMGLVQGVVDGAEAIKLTKEAVSVLKKK